MSDLRIPTNWQWFFETLHRSERPHPCLELRLISYVCPGQGTRQGQQLGSGPTGPAWECHCASAHSTGATRLRKRDFIGGGSQSYLHLFLSPLPLHSGSSALPPTVASPTKF